MIQRCPFITHQKKKGCNKERKKKREKEKGRKRERKKKRKTERNNMTVEMNNTNE